MKQISLRIAVKAWLASIFGLLVLGIVATATAFAAIIFFALQLVLGPGL